MMRRIFLCMFLAFTWCTAADLAHSINSTALQAFQDSNLVVRDNKVILYGVRAGDVVVWISRFKGNKNGACTGGGTCHVGIMTEKGAFHNNPLGNRPILNGIGLKFGYRFKAAYRPPPDARTAAAGQLMESASR